MNLNRANYILAILEEGSISAAAHKLYISQSALSQTVRLVEEEVGLPILEREKGVMKLTFAGERYVNTVKQIFLLEKNFWNEIDEIRRELSGQFRFGIPHRIGQLILPGIVVPFRKEYPSVHMQVSEAGSARLTKMVVQGDLDMAVVRTAEFEKGICYHLLQKEQLGVFAGQKSGIYERYPDGTPIDIAEIAAEDFIFLKEGHSSRDSQDQLLEKKNLKLNAIFEIDNFETAKQMVMSCGAAMVVPYSSLQLNDEQKACTRFYPLTDAEEVSSIYLIYNESTYLTPFMKRWMELIEEMYG